MGWLFTRVEDGWLARALFLRALGLVFLCAFASAAVQLPGLVGEGGILPAAETFSRMRAAQADFWDSPSLAWFFPSSLGLRAVCGLGMVAALGLFLDVWPRFSAFLSWALYQSTAAAGDLFFHYQWDALLLEAGLVGVLVAPLRAARNSPAPTRAQLLLPSLLLFRVVFPSGMVKLLSQDPTWRDFTALSYHYWSQPIPHLLSPLWDALPMWLDKAMCAGMFAGEIVLIWLVFVPQPVRRFGALVQVVLQALVLLSGNYGFFNLLGLALCLVLVDDGFWRRHLPRFLLRHLGEQPAPAAKVTWPGRLTAAGCAFFGLLGLAHSANQLGVGFLATALKRPLAWVQPLNSLHSYGLFAVMTTDRQEILLEGSADGQRWEPYVFGYKPGPLDRTPPFVVPHLPRLDWQLWFAALSPCQGVPWFVRFQEGLLRGQMPAAVELLAHNPFPGEPPRYLRSTVSAYRFDHQGDAFWRVEGRASQYCPTLSLVDGQLRAVSL